jgi:choline dehydrogenase-like flavoprotein
MAAVDASTRPTVVSDNINATAVMIGKRSADMTLRAAQNCLILFRLASIPVDNDKNVHRASLQGGLRNHGSRRGRRA